MMESSDPPTYKEATTPPNVVSNQTSFCQHCGKAAFGGNYCAYCGRLLVQTAQPVSSGPQISYNKLPPIANMQQPAIIALPTSTEPDIQHKNDLAYKDGNRLIYDFEKVACCPGQIVGLDPRVKDELPWELESKGITKDQWRDWMVLLMDNQKLAPSIAGCLCMFCCPGLIPQSILCAMFCPISMNHCLKWLPCCYGDWYIGLRRWQDDVNYVLNQHDMHVKLMTYKPFQKAPKSKMHGSRIAGKDHNYEMSMMVISLTETETEKLKMESWDHGVNDGCTSGIGRIL